MPKYQLKDRKNYSDFNRNNPLPEKLQFLKGIRPHFCAINTVINEKTDSPEFRVEFTPRNAKTLIDSIQGDSELDLQSIKKDLFQVLKTIKEMEDTEGLINTMYSRRRDGPSMQKKDKPDIFKDLKGLPDLPHQK